MFLYRENFSEIRTCMKRYEMAFQIRLDADGIGSQANPPRSRAAYGRTRISHVSRVFFARARIDETDISDYLLPLPVP